MAVTLKETEGTPSAWPTVTPYPAATAWEESDDEGLDPIISPETVWRMIERWITYRWRARSIVYVVEGPGDWMPRLDPFTAITTERWTGAAWAAASLAPSPLGGYALDAGMYRITGTVGDAGAVPADVEEAWRRIHGYVLGNSSAHLDTLAFSRTEDQDGPRAYAAKALTLSGAADLLRPYRRLA